VSRLKPIVDFAAYLAVRVSVCVLQALPLETYQPWARRLAWMLWHIVRVRRSVVDANLQIAFPRSTPGQRRRIALGMWEHLLLMVAEIAHAPRKVHRTNWRRHSRIPDMALMARRLLDRRPVILISGHLGNFEMGGYVLGLHGFPTHTIARRLDNPYLDRWISGFRAATGQFMLSKEGSSSEIEKVLHVGGILALLGDQHAGDRGCWVPFFGKLASTHKAVALFTLGAQAPTATAAMVRVGGPMSFEMHVADLIDPLERREDLVTVSQVAQWYTGQLEKMIRRAPEQYWWLHQRWREPPTKIKRRRAAA
jgi:KDO2-lipid IV(A) lauroyltransferase